MRNEQLVMKKDITQRRGDAKDEKNKGRREDSIFLSFSSLRLRVSA
jgi:hypothetical protein